MKVCNIAFSYARRRVQIISLHVIREKSQRVVNHGNRRNFKEYVVGVGKKVPKTDMLEAFLDKASSTFPKFIFGPDSCHLMAMNKSCQNQAEFV